MFDKRVFCVSIGVTILSVIFLQSIYFITNLFIDTNVSFDNKRHRFSSVWCDGLNHTDRRCRFVNLCYKTDTSDYIFSFNQNSSIVSGIPVDRFSPALLDLSSVRDHNQFYFNYVEIPHRVLDSNLSLRYEIQNIRGKTLIFSRFKPDNLMHALHDDIIPAYFTLHEIGINDVSHVFADDNWPPIANPSLTPNSYFYRSLFPSVITRAEMLANVIYCFDEAYVGLSKSTVWYDYGFRAAQRPIESALHNNLLTNSIIKAIRDQLITSVDCSRNFAILISRRFTRKILNEEQLINLISKFSDFTVLKLSVEDYDSDSFEKLIETFSCAKLLIGVHGSALILSMFMRSASSVIELFPYAINPDHYTPYKTLAQLNGVNINYFSWRNLVVDNTVTHPEYPPKLGGIRHLPENVQKAIALNGDDVSPHLCCDDQQWLYRAYQDTVVDIDNFEPLLKSAIRATLSSPIHSLSNKLLAPNRVQDVRCSRQEYNDRVDIHIAWSEPWNVKYINQNYSVIVYEVLAQKVLQNFAKSYLTLNKEYTIQTVNEKNSSFNVWVRCKLDQISGPYISNPLIC